MKRRGRCSFLSALAAGAAIALPRFFAFAAGWLVWPGRTGRNDLTRAMVDGAPEGVLVTDAEGRPIYANAAYLGLTGKREKLVRSSRWNGS